MLLGLPEFDMHFPASVEEACALLARHGGEAEILAGGTDLLVKMKQKRAIRPCLVNIKRIANLDTIRDDEGGGLRIGALATIQAIADSGLVRAKLPALAEAAGMLGTSQIRNLGTLGGNLANASPSAECAPVLLTLEASVACMGPDGARVIPITEFFQGPGKSALGRYEVLTEVRVPAMAANAAAIYYKQSLRRMDVAMAGAAVYLELDGETCRAARIALGAVAPVPFRARRAEAALTGQRIDADTRDSELLDEIARLAA